MKISVIGSGYVGLVQATILAEVGRGESRELPIPHQKWNVVTAVEVLYNVSLSGPNGWRGT